MFSKAINVCIKMRPCDSEQSSVWEVVDGQSIKPAKGPVLANVFDHVFDEGASNQAVFDQVARHVVHSCLLGFNGTILAYGQSSSGKTYTMMGDAQNPGVMVLAAKEIFRLIATDSEREFLLRVGHFEIFNEKIFDLLKRERHEAQIHEAADGALSVACEEIIVASEDELLDLLCPYTNESSKALHAIFRITIESRKPECPGSIIQSILDLVDLAGTGLNALTNRSLMSLSKVVMNLSNMDMNDKFINFRDSKLTRILQPTLSGNGFTSIICAIKPWVLNESRSTLNFATLAKKIILKPHANNIVCDPRMKQLDTEIRDLQHQVAEEKRSGSPIYLQPLEGRIQEISSQFVSREKLCELSEQMQSMQCQQLQAANMRLQAEIRSLKERVVEGQPSEEGALKAFLSEQRTKVCELQAEMESQSEQMQLKDTNIAELKAEIEKQQLLDAQSRKLSDDEVNLLMEQLQEANARLAQKEVLKARLAEMELNIARLELEKREAVVLEFQFEAYKEKSSLREKYLLAALSEKDKDLQLQVGRYEAEALELQRQHQQDQQGAIEIQQKYQKLQEEYAQLRHTSSASEEQCQKLQAHNTRLQAEIQTLGKRVEEKVAQRGMKIKSSNDASKQVIEQLQKRNDRLAESRNQLEKHHEEKYVQLAIYSDNLKEEKSLLQAKTKKADAQHSRSLRKIYKLESELEHMGQQKINDVQAMKSKETRFLAEMEHMSATVSSLLQDKRNLEEKMCTLQEKVTRMEAEPAVSRAPKISGGSSSASAAPSTSTKVTSGTKKSTYSDRAMRRGRRMAAQDERRKNAFPDTSRDCGSTSDSD